MQEVKFVIDTYIFLKYYLIIRSGQVLGDRRRGGPYSARLSILTFAMPVVIILRDSAIPLDAGVSY